MKSPILVSFWCSLLDFFDYVLGSTPIPTLDCRRIEDIETSGIGRCVVKRDYITVSLEDAESTLVETLYG